MREARGSAPGGAKGRRGKGKRAADERAAARSDGEPERQRLASAGVVVPLAVFFLSFAVYWISAGLLGRFDSPLEAYFDQLADAFLHGRTFLTDPSWTDDLTLHDGRWYVPFPPLVAFLLMPWVALGGVGGVNTVVFGAILGALNVALAFVLLQQLARRGTTELAVADNLWLTALWGVGSVHWYMSTMGSVWFLGQIAGVTFVLAAACLALRVDSALLCGSALGLAMWGRPTLVLTYPLLLALGVERHRRADGLVDVRRTVLWGLRLLIPLAVSALALLGYNFVRFGDAFDTGYQTQNVAPWLVDDLQAYGQFSLHFVWRNLWAMAFAMPSWDHGHELFLPRDAGMSLLLTTPAVVYLWRARRKTATVIGAWIAIGLLLVPLLTYYNTGRRQFGYRFSLDFMTPVLVLLAIGAGRSVGRRMRLLIAAGVLVNAWGVWWFFNPRFFPWVASLNGASAAASAAVRQGRAPGRPPAARGRVGRTVPP